MKKELLNDNYKLYVLENGVKFDLKSFKNNTCYSVNVPCDTLEVLMENGVISDVYTGNPKDTEKFELNEYVFAKEFDFDKSNGEDLVLRLDGIDTIADVYLNGFLLGRTENELVEHEFDVTSLVKDKKNKLIIHILSSLKEAYNYENTPDTVFMQHGNAENGNIRKSASQYGWDILPRVMSSGITKDVYIIRKARVEIEDIYLTTLYVTDNQAGLEFFYNLKAPVEDYGKYKINIKLTCKESKYSYDFHVAYKSETKYLFLDNPKLWWPNGMGEQNLYDIKVTVLDGEKEIAVKEFKTGIRHLVLKRDFEYGDRDAFCFYINNKYLKCKGANIVPPDVLHSKTKNSYGFIVKGLKENNTNLIRIWGGGVYFDEEFYSLCDEAGILIWQDIMLSCHAYPQAEKLKKELFNEVVKVAKKYRNHASLGLYCGSNETDWSYYCVGLSPELDKLTREVIPSALAISDPHRIYYPSTPLFSKEYYKKYGGFFLITLKDIEENRVYLSEEHYWWHRDDFRAFKNIKHNFVGEIGYSGCPNISTVKKFTDNLNPFSPDNPELKKRDYATDPGFDYGVKYLFEDKIENVEDIIKATQYYQGEAYKFLLEQMRLDEKLNGVIIWTFNEGYPSFGSGLMDYYGIKKDSFYFVKNSQEPVQILVKDLENKLEFYLCNDTISDEKVEFSLYLDKNVINTGKETVKALDKIKIFETAKSGSFVLTKLNKKDGKTVYNHFAVKTKYKYSEYKDFILSNKELLK